LQQKFIQSPRRPGSAGVYRVTPDLGTMTPPVDNFIVPNGLAFSTDGVSNHGRQP
jgi:sugar lactone lactonase YvrE